MIGLHIYNALKDFCENLENPIHFTIYKHANFNISNMEFENGKMVLIANFDIRPIIKNSKITSCSYSGYLRLGRKIDNNGLLPNNGADGTINSIDEKFEKKYELRLRELTNYLFEFIASFACNYQLDISGVVFSHEIDLTDEDIDFVDCKLTFSYA